MPQRNPEDTSATSHSANENSEDAAVNARLVDMIKANAIKIDGESPSRPRLKKLGYFSSAKAVLGLTVLVVVAYVYGLLVKNEA